MDFNALRELAVLFLRLGVVSFGGPAVHIALFEQEFVVQRRWLTRERFLDLVGATNLIPGPNSTEMAMHLGAIRAGVPGLIVAGVCFIAPAALLTALLAWAYVRFGALPEIRPFLRGMAPAALAVLVGVIVRLAPTALKKDRWRLGAVGVAALAAALAGVPELVALFGGGVFGMLLLRLTVRRAAPVLVPLPDLFLYFLKIGSILYGSGYVLIAFLEGGLVNDLHWLTRRQLLDAVAVGQFTPGPLFSTATFIGYVVGRGGGAVAATVGIFLPAFVFVALLNPLVGWLRRSPWTSAFLDAINVASIALMVAVAVHLAWGMRGDWRSILVATIAGVLAITTKINSAWLVLGGALFGRILTEIGG